MSSMFTPRVSLHRPVPRNAHIICPQNGSAVDHGSVDDLSLAGDAALEQCREHAHDEEHRPAAEVAGQVERRHRTIVLAADRVEQTGERDVVDVVSGEVGARPPLLAQPVMRPYTRPGFTAARSSGPKRDAP